MKIGITEIIEDTDNIYPRNANRIVLSQSIMKNVLLNEYIITVDEDIIASS